MNANAIECITIEGKDYVDTRNAASFLGVKLNSFYVVCQTENFTRIKSPTGDERKRLIPLSELQEYKAKKTAGQGFVRALSVDDDADKGEVSNLQALEMMIEALKEGLLIIAESYFSYKPGKGFSLKRKKGVTKSDRQDLQQGMQLLNKINDAKTEEEAASLTSELIEKYQPEINHLQQLANNVASHGAIKVGGSR